MSGANDERLSELMVEEVTHGLAPDAHEELAAVLENDQVLREEFQALELAAAALHVAFVERSGLEELPGSVRSSVLNDVLPRSGPRRGATGSEHGRDSRGAGHDYPWRMMAISGWIVAAAAAVCIAIVWPGSDAKNVPGSDPHTLESVRAMAGSVSWPWAGLRNEYEQVAGEVVWNEQAQRGFMVFDGLPQNDRAASQYQLWIKDGDRKGLVDGGVFDVDGAGRAVVPIDTKLPVTSTQAFIVTRERPGGVVVSEQEHLVVIAKP